MPNNLVVKTAVYEGPLVAYIPLLLAAVLGFSLLLTGLGSLRGDSSVVPTPIRIFALL